MVSLIFSEDVTHLFILSLIFDIELSFYIKQQIGSSKLKIG